VLNVIFCNVVLGDDIQHRYTQINNTLHNIILSCCVRCNGIQQSDTFHNSTRLINIKYDTQHNAQCRNKAYNAKCHNSKCDGATTLRITTLSIMTLSIKKLSITTFGKTTRNYDIQHNDTQHNDTAL
jgi:hypothetical protein